LAQPHIAGTLLFFGGFALMVELSSPGLGAGAFVASLCFVVFFWSQFLHGTADWLEILLFLTGVAFVALEVFVIPGFGVFGLGGAALVVVSLILASQTFVVPQNEYQVQQMPQSLITVLGAGAGVTVGLFVLRRFMHRTPILRRMLLQPPEGEVLTDLERREALVDYGHLLGQEGVAATRLVPAGKAFFGDQLVDVVSRGLIVAKGTPIRVEEVHGNRIVVTSLEE
jgi:membrane-bound ClpP family serine protease